MTNTTDPKSEFDQILEAVKAGEAADRTSIANIFLTMLATTATLATMIGLLA